MATHTLTEAVAQVRRLLRDQSTTVPLIADTDLQAMIGQAVQRYSNDRPLVTVEDLTADGAAETALPDDWQEGFSVLRQVEYPVDQTPPCVLDPRSWTLWDGLTGRTILWLDERPAAGATVRLTYTRQRVLAAQAKDTTVPDADWYAVCDLAASIAADALAARYAQTSEPVLGADTVNYRSKQQEWAAIARRLEARYAAALGNVPRAASDWVNWDTLSSERQDWLWHRRALR